jgi:hypothetical protein
MSEEKTQPKAGKDVVYVDVDDDITTIINKVEDAKQKVVALVLPKRASVLKSVVNMRLLKRSSETAGKNVVLITAEGSLLPLAGAAGIHVAKSLQGRPEIPEAPNGGVAPPASDDADADDAGDAKATLDYHRSIGELAATHAAGDVITLDEDKDELPEPKQPKSSAKPQAKSAKIKVPNFERFRLMMGGGILLIVGLIIFVIYAMFVLPKATVTITTASEPISANLTLNASDKYTSLNEAASQIPASLKATDQTSNQQVPATGQQNNGDKATGTVTITNCTTDNSEVVVPAGTGVSTGSKTYITQKSLDLPLSGYHKNGSCTSINGASAGSTSIVAQAGGEKYNVDNASFSVAGYSAVTATGSASGGTDDNQTVVSQTDLDNARQKLTSANSDDFTKKFEQQLSDQGFYVITSTLKLSDPQITATPSLGAAASTVNVTVKITYKVLVVNKADLRKAVGDTLSEQIDKTKQKLSNDDVLNGLTVSVKSQSSDTAAVLDVSEDTTAVPIINTVQVKSIAAGHKKGDIVAAISGWPGVKSVNVKLSPFWVSKAPKSPSKIQVKLVQSKD